MVILKVILFFRETVKKKRRLQESKLVPSSLRLQNPDVTEEDVVVSVIQVFSEAAAGLDHDRLPTEMQKDFRILFTSCRVANAATSSVSRQSRHTVSCKVHTQYCRFKFCL